MRHEITAFGFIVFVVGFAVPKPNAIGRVIDLGSIGYPQPPCDYMFQVDYYAKNHIEFLDPERLIVSFPMDISGCDKKNGYSGRFPDKFRSVVMDTTGKVLHSFEWKAGEDIQAGPDGHILLLTGNEIRILDWDFSLLQSIPDVGPGHIWGLRVSPSRRGFAVLYHYPTYRVAYFEGSPARQTQEADDCDRVAVVDGGFLCFDASQQNHFTAHVSKSESQLNEKMIRSTGNDESREIADKHWLIPRWPARVSKFGESASASGQRVLYFSTGCLFPISDTNGFGYFLRAAVVDLQDKRTIFREQYEIGSDVAISPDGHSLAVREKVRLTLFKL